MEVFLERLSECQENESAIRQRREALLKRHEQELIDIDNQIVNIASQRNSILEEFKNFLEAAPSESNGSPSPTKQRPQSFHYMPKQCPTIVECHNDTGIHLQVERPSSSGGSTPISQYHSPLASPLPEIKTPIPPTPPDPESVPTLAEPVVENRRIIRSPIRRQNAETQLPKLPEVEPSPRQCTDLKLTITKPSRKLISSKILDSPATEKIEKILSQVRDNAHPLEEEAVNHCIDLLSSKCELPTSLLNNLKTPEIVSNKISPVKEEHSEAPVRRNAMRKRIETPEERKKRIESVLYGPSPEERKKQEMSRSSSNLNELDRTQSAILERNGGRRSSANVNMKQQAQGCQLRRNQSLSPLRFGTNGRSLDSIEDETTDPSMEELFLRAPVLDKRYQTLRRAKSDGAMLGDSDSFSAATSFDDDFDFESDAQQVLNTAMNADDQDHLLAPSKVAKSQNMFHKTLFGSESGKRLLTKEEIALSRKLATQNRITSQRARSFEHTSRYDDHQSKHLDGYRSPTNAGKTPGTLRAEQLVQMRGSSASPDQRQIDRELNTVANLKRFQSYQNFWEHKTKEIIDKQKRLSTISGSSDSRPSSRGYTMDARTDKKPTIADLVKPETVSPKPTKKKTPKSGTTASKSNSTSKAAKTTATTAATAFSQFKESSISNNNSNNTKTKDKESKSLLDRFSFFTNKKKEESAQPKTLYNGIVPNNNITTITNNNNNNKKSSYSNGVDHNNNTIADNGYHPSNQTNSSRNHQSNSVMKHEIENDQLYQRVRNIHEDIRKRKIQQQSQSHQLPSNMNAEHRPSIQSAKSLDLQYYALKAKQVPIKLIQPNGPEPGLAKNRLRLIKTAGNSRDNSTNEQSSDDNFDALSQVSFASSAISDCSMQHMRPHNRINAFRETALHKPMKSTYF